MKAVHYPNASLEEIVLDQFWIEEECKYDIAAITVRTHMRILSVVRKEVFSMYGYDYMKKIVIRRADLNEHVIMERDFKYLYPSNFEELYLLNLQGHLNHLLPKDKKILITAVNQWTRHLVIRQRVKDFQLGIESYQTQLNHTKPQWDATGFKYKHDYTVIDSSRAVMFRDRYGVQMMMRFNEIHKFSDDTLKDVDRSKEFMFAIQKRLKTRRIFCNLESFVGRSVQDGDYRLLKLLGVDREVTGFDLFKGTLVFDTFLALFARGFLNGVTHTSFPKSNDVTRLQALVDKKKVLITEATIRDVLRLDDAEGVDCLPNKEIFAELARMGRKFNFFKYIFESLVRNVDSSSKFYMDPRVGKGCLWVETPLFEGMLLAGEPDEQGDAEEQIQGNDNDAAQGADTIVSRDDVHDQSSPSPVPPEALDACAALTRRVEHLEHDKVAKALEIIKLKKRVKKLERANKGRMIANLDRDEGIALMDDEGAKKKAKDAQVAGDEQVKGRQAEIYQIDMDHASKVLSMQEDEPKMMKGVVIRDLKEESTAKTPVETKSKDKGKGIMVEEPKPVKKKQQRYQVMKKRPQTEAQARRNMIMYLKNVAGFRLDYFKGMSYDDIHPIFKAKFNSNIEFLLKSKEQIEEEENRAIESINKTPAQKAAKRRKLNEEVEELKQHLEIVPDEDDDVYTEATPLARKVPVVDYEIVHFNNKPHYKIIRADGTHQLYLILLVERRYPLSRFTLDQMLNAVRLRVEEQSQMSLELLSFGVDAARILKKNTKCLMLLINDDDLEEMDLKWQVAMISMRIKKFHKRTG
nr:hypothetical protein [Tanacetum cinerariifolium]